MPISYIAISTYARDHGITGVAFNDFLRAINQLDRVFLEVEAARQEEVTNGG